jgi:hypothetical protein
VDLEEKPKLSPSRLRIYRGQNFSVKQILRPEEPSVPINDTKPPPVVARLNLPELDACKLDLSLFQQRRLSQPRKLEEGKRKQSSESLIDVCITYKQHPPAADDGASLMTEQEPAQSMKKPSMKNGRVSQIRELRDNLQKFIFPHV